MKKYTRKQICEAIKYWQKRLNEMNEAGSSTVNIDDVMLECGFNNAAINDVYEKIAEILDGVAIINVDGEPADTEWYAAEGSDNKPYFIFATSVYESAPEFKTHKGTYSSRATSPDEYYDWSSGAEVTGNIDRNCSEYAELASMGLDVQDITEKDIDISVEDSDDYGPAVVTGNAQCRIIISDISKFKAYLTSLT